MTESTMVVLQATSFALVVVLYVWFALALAAVFAKMGEPAWKAWVPVYNVATILRLGGFSPWLVLLNIVPIFGLIAFVAVYIVAVHRITTSFGAGAGMTVVGALFPIVWASILGWGSARWEGGIRRSEAPDEESAPVRRGRDFDGPYVPLIGGWTPGPAVSSEPSDVARSHDAASGLDDLGFASERAEDRADQRPAAVSEPVVLPFAAPTGSLADAVPSASDWAPPADPRPVTPRDDVAPAPAAAPPTASVFDVLDALRDRSPAEEAQPAPAAPEPAVESEPATRALPVTPPTAADAPSWSAPAPVREAHNAPQAAADTDGSAEVVAPWITPPRRTTAADAPIADVPLTRPAPEPAVAPRAPLSSPGDEFPELSEAVSAVSENPDAGSPRSARTSVSSLYTQPEVPPVAEDDFDALDRTVVTRRKRIPWALVPPTGGPVDLTSPVVILGRRPSPDPTFPDAQLVAISDETRTVSKTHARLELRGDTWYVTDLDSTNGVLFATLMGTEVEAPPGEEIEAGERFFLGDAEVRLARSEA
ncbi:DUF5684 domain-containing protein [Microbacterium testaceum]|uniref:FHA domain-containing protein n=1 Tax=Microbacterium testaceum TaxID=2033 RepID=A0A2T7VPL2_MICTE|nr:DUF5684 domain-containing protein [Microbacterium testaceum]PVE58774.1 hypothetical protein DC432_15740 [Microbacterium testaceum]